VEFFYRKYEIAFLKTGKKDLILGKAYWLVARFAAPKSRIFSRKIACYAAASGIRT
jgi:hypothetical protein